MISKPNDSGRTRGRHNADGAAQPPSSRVSRARRSASDLFPSEHDDLRAQNRKGWSYALFVTAIAATAFLPDLLEARSKHAPGHSPVRTVLSSGGALFPAGLLLDWGQETAVLCTPQKGGAVVPSNPPNGSAPPPLTLTMSVFGNGDGEVGRRFADGDVYRPESWAFACNDFPLTKHSGKNLRVTMPDGTVVVAPNKDRMAKRFTGKRIDATVRVWKALTSRGYGLIRGTRVEQVK